MAVTAGKDVVVSIDSGGGANSLTGVRDATINRSRLELVTSTVGDDAEDRRLGLKDVTFSFSGVADPTATPFVDIMNAARDGSEVAVTYQHSTDGAANDEFYISACICTSMEITASYDGLVEFSAEVSGTDTTNGWQRQ